jgi:hypothetical protein
MSLPFGGGFGFGLIANLAEHHDELVTGDASDKIVTACRGRHAAGDLDQNPIAGVMTQGVVDGLEPIQVRE